MLSEYSGSIVSQHPIAALQGEMSRLELMNA